jgi:hypothetical protein
MDLKDWWELLGRTFIATFDAIQGEL